MSTIQRFRAAIVVLGLMLVFGAVAVAPDAMATPTIDPDTSTTSTQAPSIPATQAPTLGPPPSASRPSEPSPGNCDTTGAPTEGTGRLVNRGATGPVVTATLQPSTCDAPTAPTATSSPTAPPTEAPATEAPATPIPPSTSTPGVPAAPGPIVHSGAVFPPSTEAPKPTINASTPALTTLANAIVIRSRSVSTVVTVPGGLPVPATTEVSILFGYSGSSRQTQTYDPSAGNRFVFDFDAGNGAARTEDVAVSLFDRGDGSHVGFVAKVPVEALYDVSVSPLTFTLINDCSWFFKTEVKIGWRDDRGTDDDGQQFRMDPWDSRTMLDLARTVPGVTVGNSPRVPQIWWEHVDVLDIWAVAIPNPSAVPLVAGGTRSVTFQQHALGDEACNGTFHYSVTVSSPLTYRAL